MARSKKVEAALAKQKEAKQKKVLFLLIPLFIGLMAWQGPKTFKALTGGNTPPTATTAAPATTTGAPTPGSAPSTPGAGAPATPSQLVDTDTPPAALDGQLTNFSVFPSRDPFSGGPPPAGTTTDDSGTTTSQTRTSAHLQINGSTENVSIGDTFPESDPVFKLVSVTAQSAVIALASGQNFTDGQASEVLQVGGTLTVAGDDGSSFVINLLSTS